MPALKLKPGDKVTFVGGAEQLTGHVCPDDFDLEPHDDQSVWVDVPGKGYWHVAVVDLKRAK